MSKTKQMLDKHRGNQPIDYGKFLDDDYQYQQYMEDVKRKAGEPPIVSKCCKAPISFIAPNNFCTKCKRPCEVYE